ncbi:SAM domain-containing protein SAMSN-1a isoform X1 [Synchiropus splendidus]|uniref:SAM domain-containing protein SAMSN-1a isoform X1 n=1 Tax=Synchiropus splendidus TaxID=270530 RepID=UPI00237E0FC0|nr:SAM domain-containing protein SAMSN-1a isoform X1 [Synchiropus splendidus]
MNLFCFSLEGSMDSLYEAVQSGDGPPAPVPSRCSSRACSPALLLEENSRRRESGRSTSMELSSMQRTNSNKKNKRSNVPKSASDNQTLDNAAAWQPARSREDLLHVTNHNEEGTRTRHRTEGKAAKGSHHSGVKKKGKQCTTQSGPNNSVEAKHTAKRGQKPGKKAAGKSGKETVKKGHNPPARSPHPAPSPPAAPHYLDVPYRSDRRPYSAKCSTLPAQENTTPGRNPATVHLPGGATPTHSHRWSNPGDGSPLWGGVQHTCRRPLTEYRVYSHDFIQIHEETQPQQAAARDNSSKEKVPRSVTDTDLTDAHRSTSFGKFEGTNRHHSSPAKVEGSPTQTVAEAPDSLDPHKSAGLGKKMKAISLTMRRKMGKKHSKSLSEETMGDDADGDAEAETSAEKSSAKTSLESLHSGQSSSSGVASEPNGCGPKEEDGSYQGPFCGRARVHTDFVPSPYDTDSLKLKVGDIISIISKPPMGIWTGKLNNKVGNFKFIYVDVLLEKAEEDAPKIRQQKICKRPRPKTLLELLERLNLKEYASALLLNGYQTVEDLAHLQEKHLIELNVKDPEHRRQLLAAAGCHYAEGEDVPGVEESKSAPGLQEEDSDCPRDSGCFIPSECSDRQEDAEPLAEALDS